MNFDGVVVLAVESTNEAQRRGSHVLDFSILGFAEIDLRWMLQNVLVPTVIGPIVVDLNSGAVR